MNRVLTPDEISKLDPNMLLNPLTGKPFTGLCGRCRSLGSNKKNYVVEVDLGKFKPICLDCLTGGELAQVRSQTTQTNP
jgi:hypothetical protein